MTRLRSAFFGASVLFVSLACSSSPATSNDAAGAPSFPDGTTGSGDRSGTAGGDAGVDRPPTDAAEPDGPASTSSDASVVDAASTIDGGPGSDGSLAADRSAGVDAATDGGGYPEFARVGTSCDSSSAFGFGDGSLLMCKSGQWRYAIRADVPDGTPGAFKTRPSWYPPLGVVLHAPVPLSCPAGGMKLTDLPVAPVGYQLQLQSQVAGVLAVRVNQDNTLTVEKRPDVKSAAAFTGFSAQAETFWR